MKRILTAIGNPMLNNKLKEGEDFELLSEDIQTDNELLEILEREEVDVLFLCSSVIKNFSVEQFIEMIKRMHENILIIFFKNADIPSSVEEDDNLKIYNTLDLDLKIFEKILQKAMKKNIRKLTCKTIAISGASGVGKSTFSTFLAKNVENEKMKTLLMDFDLDENQVRTLLKIKKQPKYDGNVRNMVVKVNKNLDVLCHLDSVFQARNEVDFFKMQEMLNSFKEEYNLIIIDTSARVENEYTKRVFYNSDEIIFLMEPNILGVKKAKNILEVFENDWKIPSSKIKLILNKTNIYQISDSIIEELFPDIKILGKMRYLDSYNLMINKNIDKKEIKKEYYKIYKKIM